jgi:hypothetical protein
VSAPSYFSVVERVSQYVEAKENLQGKINRSRPLGAPRLIGLCSVQEQQARAPCQTHLGQTTMADCDKSKRRPSLRLPDKQALPVTEDWVGW